MTHPPSLSPIEVALARYHAQYDNATFRALHTALRRDAGYDSEALTHVLNQITDLCLGLCGHPDYRTDFTALTVGLGNLEARPETVRLIGQHLENFEEDGSPFSAEFEHITLVYLEVQSIAFWRTIALSRHIRSDVGAVVGEWLSAAQDLIRLAGWTLIGEVGYGHAHARLERAEAHLASGKRIAQTLPLPSHVMPFRALVRSADGLSVGVVVEVREGEGIAVCWYPDGIAHPNPVREWVSMPDLHRLIWMTENEWRERFDELPALYQQQ